MDEATHGTRPDVKHVPLPDDVAEWMGMDQDAAPLAVALSETRREAESAQAESAQADPQTDPEPTRAQ